MKAYNEAGFATFVDGYAQKTDELVDLNGQLSIAKDNYTKALENYKVATETKETAKTAYDDAEAKVKTYNLAWDKLNIYLIGKIISCVYNRQTKKELDQVII